MAPRARTRHSRSGRWSSLRGWLIGAAAALASACGHSPPTQFFTLTPVRPEHPRSRVGASPVQVRVVHVPELLDRPQRVVQSSQQRLDILDQQRWGAPLNDMVRRILTEDLTARLPPGMVLAPELPAPPNARGIVVYIEEFQPEPDGRVVLDVSWSVVGGPASQKTASAAGDPRETQHFEVGAAEGPDAQVAAMSQLLGQLADAIVSTLEHRG